MTNLDAAPATPDPSAAASRAAGRPRRSALYMPGSNARALDKARSLPADMLILDLEDAVAPDAKDRARAQVAECLAARPYGAREVVIRINGLDTGWGHEDVPAAATSGCDAVLLPKTESADQIHHLDSLLRQWGAPEELAIMCMMETPSGVLNAPQIAAASARVTCLVMGTNDLAKDLHAEHTRDREPMIASLGLCLLAARANGLAIVDGVHSDLDDGEGFVLACRQGRAMGFDGKTLIHPKQVAVANEIFAPSAAEVEHAQRVIAAHAAADAKGEGVALLDGKLIEGLHVENAERLVALSAAIADLEGAGA